MEKDDIIDDIVAARGECLVLGALAIDVAYSSSNLTFFFYIELSM